MTMGRQERGFTLVEVLVALAICSLSLVSFYRFLGDGLQVGNAASVREVALAHAEALMERIGADLPIVDTSDKFENGMTWQLEAIPLAERERGNGSVAQIWILLTVRDSRGSVVAKLQTGKVFLRRP